ncbi:MAG TPA: methyltransferase [Vicinamibacterales bacterium]|nr:methyltransferase [Vicinamibacterales bacterium]
MFDLTSVPQTNPVDVYRVRDAMYAPDMLIAALVHLDFFTWLGEHPSTKEEICRGLEITDRPTDVMLTLFAAMRLVEERQRVFHLTTLAREHLVKGSPWHLEPYFASVKNRPVTLDLLKVLRTGKPANWGSQETDKDWHKSMETEAFATQFTAAMDCRGVYLAQAVAKSIDVSGYRHLLDIAGGSGIYACSMVAHYPQLAATVLEKPPVDRIAAGAIANRGCAENVRVVARDMLTMPLPTDADVHLFSNVLHDWDEPVVRELLQKSFDALLAGGLVVVHDAFLNAEKNGPLHVAEYSVLLMHSSEGRCYSVAEMEQYLRDAGFSEVTSVAGAAARGIMTAKRRS